MANITLFSERGTIWSYSSKPRGAPLLARRHDGFSLVWLNDGYYVALNAESEPLFETKSWPPDRTDFHPLIAAFDHNHPPIERMFLCGSCKVRFVRSRETLVTFYVDKHSGLQPVCSDVCGKKLVGV